MESIRNKNVYISIGTRLGVILLLSAFFLSGIKSLTGIIGIIFTSVPCFIFILFKKGNIVGKIVIYTLLLSILLMVLLL